MEPAVPLLEVPQSRWDALSNRLAQSKGKAIVLVHPLYHDAKLDPPAAIERQFQKLLLKLLKQRVTPVIVLETPDNILLLQRLLKEHRAPDHLIIPTEATRSRVLVAASQDRVSMRHEHPGLTFADKLAAAGVKTVLVGGKYSYRADSPYVFPEPAVTGAVSKYEAGWLARKPAGVKRNPQSCLRLVRASESSPVVCKCAGSTYARLVECGKFDKVRLIPELLYPDKPAYFGANPKAKSHAGRMH